MQLLLLAKEHCSGWRGARYVAAATAGNAAAAVHLPGTAHRAATAHRRAAAGTATVAAAARLGSEVGAEAVPGAGPGHAAHQLMRLGQQLRPVLEAGAYPASARVVGAAGAGRAAHTAGRAARYHPLVNGAASMAAARLAFVVAGHTHQAQLVAGPTRLRAGPTPQATMVAGEEVVGLVAGAGVAETGASLLQDTGVVVATLARHHPASGVVGALSALQTTGTGLHPAQTVVM